MQKKSSDNAEPTGPRAPELIPESAPTRPTVSPTLEQLMRDHGVDPDREDPSVNENEPIVIDGQASLPTELVDMLKRVSRKPWLITITYSAGGKLQHWWGWNNFPTDRIVPSIKHITTKILEGGAVPTSISAGLRQAMKNKPQVLKKKGKQFHTKKKKKKRRR